MLDDRDYMAQALEEAQRAAELGEVPVGAVLVDASGRVLAAAGNAQINQRDATAHAEIRVLRLAGQRLENYRLPGTTLYVTLEPCTMCCGALVHARVEQLYFGALEPKAGAGISTASLLEGPALNHRVRWQGEIMADASARLLKAFFAARR